MISAAGVEGKRIGVLGLGRSGLAAAKAIAAGGGAPVCGDDRAEGREAAAQLGFETADLSDPAVLSGLNRLLVSPGIPHLYPAAHPAVAASARLGLPLDNDVGLFMETLRRLDPSPLTIAITGSNGKSTTAALIHHLLTTSGRPAQLGGNIGRGVFDLDPPRPGEIYVLELSSYQTELAARLAPTVAVLTNLTPDHLDRHGGIGGYFAAKRRLFTAGRPLVSVIGVDEPEGRFLAQSLAAEMAFEAPRSDLPTKRAAPLWRVSVTDALEGTRNAMVVRDGVLLDRARPSPTIGDLNGLEMLPGRHNHQNIALAAAAIACFGVGDDDLRRGLASFGGLAHRLQRIAVKDGVAFVNDSKATNAEAAEKALSSFERIRWIAGGRAKEGGIESLKPLFGRIAKAYLIGECADSFAATIGDAFPVENCGTVEKAVAQATAEAQQGETVLLSPAAASFDQYPDFEARGRAFQAAVDAALS